MSTGFVHGEGEAVSPAALAALVESYVAQHPAAAVLEEGQLIFDMRQTRYSIADSHGRCVLQLWSQERNIVRTVVSAQVRSGALRLMTRRLGAVKPVALEVVPTPDRRTPTARDTERRQYMRLLERALLRSFPDCKPEGFRSASDLEHSFGPAYIRGHLLRGTKAYAVIGVGAQESSATVDGVLTLGLLWLDYCRERQGTKSSGRSRHYDGLKVIVPKGAWQTTAERMAWLNHSLAGFQLFALDEQLEDLTEVDFRDTGNLDSRLVHAFDAAAGLERAQRGVSRVLDLVPEDARGRVELRARSAAEVGLLLHGLEFARVRQSTAAHSFSRQEEITFGAGANETVLNTETGPLCRELLGRLFASRRPDGGQADSLYRLQPERWLESRIRIEMTDFLPALRGEFLYSQVPAISSGERGMLDLLTIDRAGRLMIVEVKADEDMHLPLQGLDYWIHVRALNADRRVQGNRDAGAFERQGYFSGTEISPRSPKLLLVAPALRIHPSNEIVLKYLSPQVEWELIAVSEHWRRELKVVFRKRNGSV
jgi:hypothetical protein